MKAPSYELQNQNIHNWHYRRKIKRKEKRDLRDSNKIIAKSNICFSKIYLSFAYKVYLNKIKVNLSTCNALKLNWEIFWGVKVQEK